MSDMVLPTVTEKKKTLLFFSGGVDSTMIALRMKKKYKTLDNVVAVFFPINALYQIYKRGEKNYDDTRLQNQYSIFNDMCEEVGLKNRIVFLTIEDFTYQNGDNFIIDRRRQNVASLLNLFWERGVDLTDKHSITFGINKRIFEGRTLLNHLKEKNITSSDKIAKIIKAGKKKYRGIIERDAIDAYSNYPWLEKQNSYSIISFDELIENNKVFLPLEEFTKSDVYKLLNTLVDDVKIFTEKDREIVMKAHNMCDVAYPSTCGQCDTCIERTKTIS